MMPVISQEEVALITDERNVYMAGAVDTDCAEAECIITEQMSFKRNLIRAS